MNFYKAYQYSSIWRFVLISLHTHARHARTHAHTHTQTLTWTSVNLHLLIMTPSSLPRLILTASLSLFRIKALIFNDESHERNPVIILHKCTKIHLQQCSSKIFPQEGRKGEEAHHQPEKAGSAFRHCMYHSLSGLLTCCNLLQLVGESRIPIWSISDRYWPSIVSWTDNKANDAKFTINAMVLVWKFHWYNAINCKVKWQRSISPYYWVTETPKVSKYSNQNIILKSRTNVVPWRMQFEQWKNAIEIWGMHSRTSYDSHWRNAHGYVFTQLGGATTVYKSARY